LEPPVTLAATLSLAAVAQRQWEVVIVGAGPAGAFAARELARSGVAVLLIDQASFPRWKICGACLNGRGLAILAEVGLGGLAAELRATPLTTLQLGARGRTARLDLPGGVALSRAALDTALVEAAVAAGAVFLPETTGTLRDLTSDGRRVGLRQSQQEAEVTAGLVLAASGLNGNLRGQPAELRTKVAAGSRIGAGVRAEQGPAEYVPGTVFMAVGNRGYVGLVRVEDGSLNIAAALEGAFIRESGGLGEAAVNVIAEAGFPAIDELAELPWRGTPPLTREMIAPAAERVFVLGDAAGYIEPFTGEGISWGLAAGKAIAPLALRAARNWRDDFREEWSVLLRQSVGRRQGGCRLIAGALRHPAVTLLAIRVLEWMPRLAAPLVRRFHAPDAR
jgi:flavin-dependent dehydrogenase